MVILDMAAQHGQDAKITKHKMLAGLNFMGLKSRRLKQPPTVTSS
jgi:hypothetical protein